MKEKLPKVRKGGTWVWEIGVSLTIGIISNWSLTFDVVGKKNRDWSWTNKMLQSDEQAVVVNTNRLTNLVVTEVIMI